MNQISFYHSSLNSVVKTSCQLLEKCYSTGLKVIVMAELVEIIEELDSLLWTYSRKLFIPHATNKDPLPHLQPIFITNIIQNPNNASVFMAINPTNINAEEVIRQFQRVIIIYNDRQEEVKEQISKLQAGLSNINILFTSYKQDVNNSWVKY